MGEEEDLRMLLNQLLSCILMKKYLFFNIYLLGSEHAKHQRGIRGMTPWPACQEIRSREGYQKPVVNENVCGSDTKCR